MYSNEIIPKRLETMPWSVKSTDHVDNVIIDSVQIYKLKLDTAAKYTRDVITTYIIRVFSTQQIKGNSKIINCKVSWHFSIQHPQNTCRFNSPAQAVNRARHKNNGHVHRCAAGGNATFLYRTLLVCLFSQFPEPRENLLHLLTVAKQKILKGRVLVINCKNH